jgi:hypothetical protein
LADTVWHVRGGGLGRGWRITDRPRGIRFAALLVLHPAQERATGPLSHGGDDSITRVDVIAPGIATTDGVEVGSTTEQLKRLYGDTMETASSLGGDLEFWLWSKDANRRRLIVFVTDGHRIVSYRAGDRQAAQIEE